MSTKNFKWNENEWVQSADDVDAELFALMRHKHDGTVITAGDVPNPPNVTLGTNGSLLVGTEYHYKISLVDEFGRETGASEETVVTTPTAMDVPQAPGLVAALTGGTLGSGTFLYMYSWYVGNDPGKESLPGPSSATRVASTTGKVTLTLPNEIPDAATGVNVYRQSANGNGFFLIASVNLNVATPPTTYVDTGAAAQFDHTPPFRDSTIPSISAVVEFPGATPVVPDGFTWKIYRSNRVGDWTNSLVHHVIERTGPSGPIVTSFTDYGGATFGGQPAIESGNVTLTNPDQINLTDSEEVQGTLPLGLQDNLNLVNLTVPLKNGPISEVCITGAGQLFSYNALVSRNGDGFNTLARDIHVVLQKLDVLGGTWVDVYDMTLEAGSPLTGKLMDTLAGNPYQAVFTINDPSGANALSARIYGLLVAVDETQYIQGITGGSGTFDLTLNGVSIGAVSADSTDADPGGDLQTAVDAALGSGKATVTYAPSGHPDVQYVVVTPGGGTFTLTFGGDTTSALAADGTLTSSALQAALEALASIGSGNVLVETDDEGGFGINFVGTLVNAPQSALVIDETSVTGGGSVDLMNHVPGSPDPAWLINFHGTLGAQDIPDPVVDDSGVTGGSIVAGTFQAGRAATAPEGATITLNVGVIADWSSLPFGGTSFKLGTNPISGP